jgi:Flp pilus assembly protein TadD
VRGLRGLYFQRVGNYRNALTEFQAAASLEDQNPSWQVSIGETYSKLGDLIRAKEAYQAAIELAPEDPSYWRLLATFCAQNNVNIQDIGISAAQKAVILSKGDAPSRDVLGWLYLLNGQNEDAEQMLTRALELEPQNASVHLHLGMLYLQTGDRAQAYNYFVKARDLGSADAQAILNQYFP